MLWLSMATGLQQSQMTKLFEMVQRGKISDLIAWCQSNELRGEFTVVIKGKEEE
jgi:16S rRNA C1402 (ribose-2'-O) methylase RsmI